MTTTTITDLLASWDSPEGHPYKGTLIVWQAYEADPDNIGCMCAQGQVLHLIGGWDRERLRVDQATADVEVAKLLNISRAHAVLLRNVNDNVNGAPAIVLTDPGKVLGDQWGKLLDFWHYMADLDVDGWQKVAAARDAAGAAAGAAVWAAARDAAGAAAGAAVWAAAWDAAGAAAWAAAGAAAWAAAGTAAWDAAGAAAWEIQGAVIFNAAKRPFYFLPMFGFATPDEIPARPADYGLAGQVAS